MNATGNGLEYTALPHVQAIYKQKTGNDIMFLAAFNC
jgi:hypothetical protein